MAVNKIILVSGVQFLTCHLCVALYSAPQKYLYYDICLVRILQLNKNSDSEIKEK